MIHEQVQKQLDYLKSLVDGEVENEKRCKEWGVRYTPSRRKWEDIELYEAYKREIDRDGDRNLLVWVRLRGEDEDGVNMRGVFPFAKRYVEPNRQGEYYLVYRDRPGSEVLFRDSQVEIVRRGPRLEDVLAAASRRSEAARGERIEGKGLSDCIDK